MLKTLEGLVIVFAVIGVPVDYFHVRVVVAQLTLDVSLFNAVQISRRDLIHMLLL